MIRAGVALIAACVVPASTLALAAEGRSPQLASIKTPAQNASAQ